MCTTDTVLVTQKKSIIERSGGFQDPLFVRNFATGFLVNKQSFQGEDCCPWLEDKVGGFISPQVILGAEINTLIVAFS